MGVGAFSSMPQSHLKGHENFSSDCLSASPQRLYSAVLLALPCVCESKVILWEMLRVSSVPQGFLWLTARGNVHRFELFFALQMT